SQASIGHHITRYLAAALIACLLTTSLSIPAALAAESDLKVGAGAAEFTATDDMIIGGGIGGGTVQGQEGRRRAGAVVLEKRGAGKFAIVACDVLFVTDAMVSAAAAEIEKRCGIPRDHLLVNATHTHSAPSTVRVHGYAAQEGFVRNVTEQIVKAVEQADK